VSSLRLHRVFEWLELQDLIDEALYEVYGDYDMSESIQTRAVAIHHDGFHRVISLREVDGLSGLQATLEEAVTAIDGVGGRVGFAPVYVKENGRELVFIAAINATEKGICALELKRRTGDPPRDLLPVSDDADTSFVETLEWGGVRREVDVQITNEIRI
jgi:hypothetical protein